MADTDSRPVRWQVGIVHWNLGLTTLCLTAPINWLGFSFYQKITPLVIDKKSLKSILTTTQDTN